jgi:hypothetical protein
LLKTFQFVPEDKLKWSPSPTARTPLQIVAHCGVANRAFATVLRGEPLPLSSDPKEAAAQIRDGGKDTATREAAVKLVEDGTAEVLAALDTVSTERAGSTTHTPFGPLPFSIWMNLPSEHMTGHAHQVNYLQTIWGDAENHF